jgi:hypothetical protein
MRSGEDPDLAVVIEPDESNYPKLVAGLDLHL